VCLWRRPNASVTHSGLSCSPTGRTCRLGRRLLLTRRRETETPTTSPGLSDTEMSAVSRGLGMGMMSVEDEGLTPTPVSLPSGLAAPDADAAQPASVTRVGDEASEGQLSDPRELKNNGQQEDNIDFGQYRDGLKNLQGGLNDLEGDVQVPEDLPPIGSVQIPQIPIGSREEDSDHRPLDDISLNDDYLDVLPLDEIDDMRLDEASAAPFSLNPLPLHNKPSTVFVGIAVALTGIVSVLGVYITWKRDRLSGRWRGLDPELSNENRSLLGKQGVGSYGSVVATEVTPVEDDGAL
jgi:hypothetical protein